VFFSAGKKHGNFAYAQKFAEICIEAMRGIAKEIGL